MGGEDRASGRRRRSRKAWVIGGVLAVLVVAGTAVAAYALHIERQADAEVSASEQVVAAVNDEAATCQSAAASAKQVLTEIEGRVDDQAAYDRLQTVAQAAERAAATEAAPAVDEMSLDEARAATGAATRVLDDLRAACEPLAAAVERAEASHQAFVIAEAQAGITAVMNAGEETLAATEGRVDDNSVRQALRDALDSAKAQRDALTFEGVAGAGAISADVQAKAQAVNEAVAARDARIAAEQKAAADAAARAAAQKKASSSNSSGSKSGGSSSRPSGGSGSGKPSGGSSSKPSGGGSGGGSSSGGSGGGSSGSGGGSGGGGGSQGARPPKIGGGDKSGLGGNQNPNWDGNTTFG